MTNSEFSNQFDVLYNNIMSNQAPGLDEYEKSVFLTKAQDEVVRAYFNPKGNKVFEGYDGNEKRQIDFSMITATDTITTFSAPAFDPRGSVSGNTVTGGIAAVSIPDNIIAYINELLVVTRSVDGSSKTVYLTVVPISYTEYALKMSKPYKRPLQYQAWRILDNTSTTQDQRQADLIAAPNDAFVKYVVRYIKRPRAIILVNLETGLTIDQQSTAQTCELDPILHEEILQRAVELAKAAYTGDLNSQVALGNTSQTNIGVVGAPRQ